MQRRPLLIQQDRFIYADTTHEEYGIVRPILQDIADLIKTPSTTHIYQVSEQSIWYACEQGIEFHQIKTFFEQFGKLSPPKPLLDWMEQQFYRFGLVEIIQDNSGQFCLRSKEKGLIGQILKNHDYRQCPVEEGEGVFIDESERGWIKAQFMAFDYPVRDQGGYEEGTPLPIETLPAMKLRSYQKEAVEALLKRKQTDGGNGVIILPCGAGKTIVGLALMAELKQEVLILTPNDTSLRQWARELMDKTTIDSSKVGFYSSTKKELAPVTIATYQMLTHRNAKTKKFSHLPTFQSRKWGLVIYDEVHLLPAPLFRFAASLQSVRRVGLTATCVREDKKEKEIFSLIGPKRYEIGIQSLERHGWLAHPVCKEIKVPFDEHKARHYWESSKRDQFRIASENPKKLDVVEELLKKHKREKILIIGQYIDQLEQVAKRFSYPLITGQTPKEQREVLFEQFRNSKISTLILSRVANLALDLPDAQVGIQLSGTFGSRQEEAQRIGRLLRPSQQASVHFYSLVTPFTKEQERAMNRQLFMVEQGYEYESEEWSS
ncbi:DNA repair helicase XPB [Alteribacter populi]|uniref:DNA repair helicase XPB n=1 Tax=Alteribacter populi TaxID=2011011 RepID=UPI001E38FC89|nr:DNA repair helicase XPB [Alteribacter populi]